MTVFKRLIFGFLFVVSACQTVPSTLETPELQALTLAQLHREADQSYSRCQLESEGRWVCGPSSSYIVLAKEIPPEVAPFMAQIYLHPEFTTEQDLLRQGAQDLPRWRVRHVCGGALVAPNWIATAAHCLKDPQLDTLYGVRIGLSNISVESGELYRVAEVVRRAPFEPTRDQDIALVRFIPSETAPQSMSFARLASLARQAPAVINVLPNVVKGTLLALDGNGSLHVLDMLTGERLTTARFGGGFELLGSQDVLTWGPDQITVASLNTNDAQLSVAFPEVRQVERFADGRRVVGYAEESGQLGIVDISTGAFLVDTIVPRRSGQPFLVAEESKVFFGWGLSSLVDVESGDRIDLNPDRRLRLIGIYADKTRLVFQHTDTLEVTLVDAFTGNQLQAATLPKIEALSGASSDEVFVAKVADGTGIQVFDGATLDLVGTITDPNNTRINTIEWAADGDHLIVLRDYDRVFDLVDMSTLDKIDSVAFSDSGQFQYVRETDQPDTFILDAAYPVQQSAESFISSEVATYVLRVNRALVQLQYGPLDQLAAGELPRMEWLAPSVDMITGTRLGEGRTSVWDLSQCQFGRPDCDPAYTLDHNVPVRSVSVSEDGATLTALAANGTVQVWSLSTGQELVRVFHGGIPLGAQFNASENQLTTYGENGFLRVWDINSGLETQRVDFAQFATSNVDPLVDPAASNIEAMALASVATTYLEIDDGGEGLYDGAPVRVFGWGRFGETASTARSLTLREAGLRVLTSESCRAPQYLNDHKDLHKRVFCAQDLERKTCVGDSGGPVVQGDAANNMKLVGIASWGSSKCESDNHPGVYTRIADYADWIKSVITDDLPAVDSLLLRAEP